MVASTFNSIDSLVGENPVGSDMSVSPSLVPRFVYFRGRSHRTRIHRPDSESRLRKRRLLETRLQDQVEELKNLLPSTQQYIGTNERLTSYGFNSEAERTLLFLAYGVKVVQSTVHEFVIRGVTPNRETLVAALELITTNDLKYAQQKFGDTVELVNQVKRYHEEGAFLLPSNGNVVHELRQKARQYLIERYILTQENGPPPIFSLELGAGNSTYSYRTH